MSHLVSRFNGKGLVRSRSLTGRLIAAAVATLFMVALVGGTIANASTTGTGTIQSDLADYKPGQQVTLTGAGWAANEPVHIVVNDTIGQTWQHVADVTASGTGDFTDVFNLPNVFVSDYDVTATGPTSGTATTTFTDAAAGALSQCGNGTFASPDPTPCQSDSEWENGNLGASKSHYFEGDSIPYRLVMNGLATNPPGPSHVVTIEWDTTKSDKHAIDYITSFNRTVATADPCAGVASCGAPTTFPIPADPQVTGAGVTPVAGSFTLFGGTITGVSAYSGGAGFPTGDNSRRITITFTTSVSNPVLAWGGHISTRADWGASNSAVAISGSPYHTRLIDLDGSGGNQDRSLSADAVIFPASITITKDAVPDDPQDFSFSTTGGLTPSSFMLDDDSDPTLSNTKAYNGILTFTSYTFTEAAVSGWTLSFGSPPCIVTSSNGGTQTTSSSTLTVNLKEGENVSCTFTNTRQAAHLIVIKHVINDNGGTKTAGDFTMNVTGNSPSPASFAGAESPGTNVTLAPGSYSADEGAHVGYTKSLSADCSGTIAAGQTKTCTVTNNDIAPQLIVIKHVINDNGGSAVAADFTLDSGGTNDTPDNFAGAESPGTTVTLDAGSYNVTESGPSGYSASFSTDCAGSIAVGQTKTCTVTNNDQAATLIVIKHVINDNGGSAVAGDFTLDSGGTNDSPDNFAGAESPGTTVTLDAGSYDVSETGPSGYTESDSADCSGTIAVGQTKTCTVTNNDQPGTIIIQKIIKPTGSTTSFNFSTTGTGYAAFAITGGQQNSQTLNAGAYTVKELVPLGWVLTGIGQDPADPNHPYDCTVTGSGGSTGVGDLSTQTAAINLKNGDTVTCVFENTGQGVTRTQGFWATHPQLAQIAWFGGTGYGHTFAGVAATAGIGDITLCGRPIDTLPKLMGGFWSDVSKTSTGVKRSALDQARMQLLQQLLAAELNAAAFGSVPSSGSFSAWESAYCGTNQTTIKNAQQQAASFNTNGDSSTFTPGTSADSKLARAIAKYTFWDVLP